MGVGAQLLLSLLALTLNGGCATPRLQPLGPLDQPPSLEDGYAVMDDGYRLPLAVWHPEGKPLAMVLALHGFNDYHNAFARVGPFLAQQGILTYAYDQRGFGTTRERGVWPGTQRLGTDLRLLIDLVRRHNPGIPLYLLGESMGGALVLVESTDSPPLRAAGILLVAPAVWGRTSMPPWQRLLLWITAHTLPGLEVTGEGLDIVPSDNVDMLRAQGRDPLVIKRTRVDALWGLTNLMDQASATQPPPLPTLVLYGESDEIIPKRAYCRWLRTFSTDPPATLRLALYARGYHMLTRDLQAERVLVDIAAWIRDPAAPLPSGEETAPGTQRLAKFCGRRCSCEA